MQRFHILFQFDPLVQFCYSQLFVCWLERNGIVQFKEAIGYKLAGKQLF